MNWPVHPATGAVYSFRALSRSSIRQELFLAFSIDWNVIVAFRPGLLPFKVFPDGIPAGFYEPDMWKRRYNTRRHRSESVSIGTNIANAVRSRICTSDNGFQLSKLHR